MKRHFYSHILNAQGEPLENIRVHVFLSDKVTGSAITSSSISNNIFTSISSNAYAYIGPSRTTTVNNYDFSDTNSSKILTDSNGFFDFWISDKETSYPSKGHDYSQRFTIAWVGDGVDVGYIEYIDIFGIHHEVDQSDNTSSLTDNKNKLLSNKLAYYFDQHRLGDYTTQPHDIGVVDVNAGSGESDYTTSNKLIANSNAVKWEDHVDDNVVGGGDVHDQYLRRNASKGMTQTTLITNLNADKLDGQEGSYYTNYTDVHEGKVSGIHGVGVGDIVGTDKIQTLTNKTLQNLTNPIDVDDGGTGSTTATGARTNLDVQQQNDNLDDISTLSPSANYFIVGDGTGFDLESPAAARNSIGVGTISTYDEDDFVATTISIPVSAGGSQEVQSSLQLTDDNEDVTLDLDAIYGSIGFFGTNAPSAQGLVNDLSTIPSSGALSGTETVDLDQMYEVIYNIHTELQKVIDIQKAHGLSS